MIRKLRPDNKAIPFFRKFVCGYQASSPAQKAQMAIMAAKTRQQLIDLITEWFQVR